MGETEARNHLKNYVTRGKVMQLSTLRDGTPWLSHVWYSVTFDPDRVYFMSNVSRNHSQYIAQDGHVAGAILAMELTELGQKVEGVVFTGTCRICPEETLKTAIESFVGRWPNAESSVSYDAIQASETPNRIYEISVAEWVLHDEVHSTGGNPRFVIDAV